MSPEAKKPLGRGLSALLGEAAEQPSVASGGRAARTVPVASIRPNTYQPRRVFSEAEMSELVESVREHGVLQPILVRRDPKDGNRYELIAGERRWRAAQAAQLHDIPAVVRDLTDREALAVALIENIQREDLNPIEEGRALRRLMDEFGRTQEQVAVAVGKSRPFVANLVRLIELPVEVQAMIERGDLSAGHGRLLVGRADATLLAATWARTKVSVREAEEIIARLRGRDETRKRKAGAALLRDSNTLDLERRLSAQLGTRVRINHKKGGQSGVLEVAYQTLDQLDDVIERLSGVGATKSSSGGD